MTERTKMPNVDRLNELFKYDNGNLYWRKKPNSKAYRTTFGVAIGTKSRLSYLAVHFDGDHYYVHRLIYKIFTNKEPDYLDHTNGDSFDNRIENLTEVSQSINVLKGKVRKNNKSGYTGVRYNKVRRKWQAYICLNYKLKSLGFFFDKESAIDARKVEQQKLLNNYETV